MMHVWEYRDCIGVQRRGVVLKVVDRGGTDISWVFHRIDADGKPIRYENGGKLIDICSGPALRSARRVGGMSVAEYNGEQA